MSGPTTSTSLLPMSISSVNSYNLQGAVLGKGQDLPSGSSHTMSAPWGLTFQVLNHLVNQDLQQGVLVDHSQHVLLLDDLHLVGGDCGWDVGMYLWVLRYKYLSEHSCYL
jgi:hypothetical protein